MEILRSIVSFAAVLVLFDFAQAQDNATNAAGPVVEGFNGKIELDVRDSTPDWTPFIPKKAAPRFSKHSLCAL